MSNRAVIQTYRHAIVNIDDIRESALLLATRKPVGGRWCAGLVRAGRGDGQGDSHRSTYRCPRSAGRPAPTPRLSGRFVLEVPGRAGAR